MSIPDEPPHNVAHLLRLERERLLDLLRGLTTTDWTLSTPCPGWNVLGLVNHLVGGDLSVVSWQRDDHRGTPSPGGLNEAEFVRWLDDLQVEWVHAARRISPRLAIQLLAWLGEAVADTFAAQDPRAWTAHVTWAAVTPVPVWLDQARELTERWIHRQQILEAVGRPSDLDGALAGPVLDSLRWAYPFRLDAAGTPADRVEIQISGPVRRVWHLTRAAGHWTFVDATDNPTATLTMTTEQAWRLLTNNYRAAAHGPLQTSGNPALIGVLRRTRAIIGEPNDPG